MFIADRPIKNEEEDFLGRRHFSRHLGESLLKWKESDSLIVALYGKWGSGKSSVITLAKGWIEKKEDSEKPTIIEFNPWLFSEHDNLSEQFFNEIAKELEFRNDSKNDAKIAQKLKLYSSILDLSPHKSVLEKLSSKILIGLGLLGITSGQIIQWLDIPLEKFKHFLFIAGFLLIIIDIFKGSLVKLSNYFEQKAKIRQKTALSLKKEIQDEIIKRNKKLLVIIDDIDRLSQSEIRQIFRLIRANADFPNTTYLLAFDREIIEKNLQEQPGISGKDYLEKIVQVNFDIPFTKSTKIAQYLFQELNRALATLPKTYETFFEQDEAYWTNIYHSGFKNFFRNIRDVKRFISSLKFNISQMYKEDVFEVNPIDFIAIEALRMFAPGFYMFMKSRNALFTSTDRDTGNRTNNPRQEELQTAIDNLPTEIRGSAVELIRRLFPQIDGVYQYGYSSHGHEWQPKWSRELKVCASNKFDAYFTFIPGGDEEELSQFEIESILKSMSNIDNFENKLKEFIEKKKVRKVLERIQDFTEDTDKIPQNYASNIVQALFNISDNLPTEKTGMGDFGANMELMRIINQVLRREEDKNKNYDILKEAIPASKGLYGPVDRVYLESERKDKEADHILVPIDKIEELQTLCAEKIKLFAEDNTLLQNEHLLFILYHWKEWGKGHAWKEFIDKVLANNDDLLLFLDKFISEERSQTMGDYGIRVIKRFNYKNLKDFADLNDIKSKLEKFKEDNADQYNNNKELIDLFLNNFDKKDK